MGKPFFWPCNGVADSATNVSADGVTTSGSEFDIGSAEMRAGSDIPPVSFLRYVIVIKNMLLDMVQECGRRPGRHLAEALGA